MAIKTVVNADTGTADLVGGDDWDAQATALNLGELYTYLVKKSGSTYYVKGSAGEVIHSGSTPSTEINWALDNLTVGRTHKETVAIAGNITFSTVLTPSSYTRLMILGNLKLADSESEAAMIKNKNSGTSLDTNIEICGGGRLDGNVAGSASAHGIVLDGVTDFSIHDLRVDNAGAPSGRGVYITTSNSGRVTRRGALYNIIANGNTDSGFEFAGTTDGLEATAVSELNISNCWSINSVTARGFCCTDLKRSNFTNCHAIGNLGSSGRGFDLSYNTNDCTFTNCYAESNDLDGFTVADSPGADQSDRNHFVNCVAKENVLFGMGVAAEGCTITGCIFDSNGQDGLRIVYSNNTISGCVAKNNGQTTANTYQGFSIIADSNVFVGCRAYDDQGTKTQRYGMALGASTDTNIILGGNYSGNLQTAGISDSGTGNMIIHNLPVSYEDIVAMTAPASPPTGTIRRYVKTVDANNDGLFIKRRLNGAVVEVQVG